MLGFQLQEKGLWVFLRHGIGGGVCVYRCVPCCCECRLHDCRARSVSDLQAPWYPALIVLLASQASSPLSSPRGLLEVVSVEFQGSQVVQIEDS